MKCFYNKAELVQDGNVYALLLDGRSITTPRGSPILHKSEALMSGILQEWQSQRYGEQMNVTSMGLTCLLHGLLDGIRKDKFVAISEMQNTLLADLTLYRAEKDGAKDMALLRSLQDAAWSQEVQAFEEKVEVLLEVYEGVIYKTQNMRSVGRIYKWLEGLDDDDILLLSTGSARCGSLVLGFCLWHGADADEIFEKCVVEERFVSDRFGVDEEEEQRQKLLLRSLEEVVLYRDLLKS